LTVSASDLLDIEDAAISSGAPIVIGGEPQTPSGTDPFDDTHPLDELLLDGQGVSLDVRQAVNDVVIEETMDGASTLTITLVDENAEILNSQLLDHAVDADVQGLEFRLAGVGWQPPMLTLTFEDRAVARLRAHDSPLRASRGKVTRAEFIYRMVREVRSERIPFYSPELHKRQPIAKTQETKQQRASRKKQHVDGFPAGAIISVKHEAASKAQKRVIEKVLQQGVDQGANNRVLIAAVMTITQESTAQNLRGGDRDSVGAFQQRASQGWPASRDVMKDAKAFYQRAIPAFKAQPTKDIGYVIDTVQRSGTFGTAQQGKLYDQWEQEARRTVSLWLGSGGKSGSETRRKDYTFTRALPPGGQKGENSWDAAQRLVQDVNWRRFMRRGVLYVVSDVLLLGRRAKLVVGPTDRGVISMPFSYDRGKRVQQVTLNAYAAWWAGAPGDHVIVRALGPASGSYLVASSRRSLFRPQVEVTLKAPTRPLPEPAADTVDQQHKAPSLGALSNHILNAYKKAKAISKKHYEYSWGGGHNATFSPSGPNHAYDCSGSVSAVLHAGGMLDAPLTTTGLLNWGAAGKGKFMTVWVRETGDPHQSHVFIDFAIKPNTKPIPRRGEVDLGGRKIECFTTGNWGSPHSGAEFKPQHHPTAGFTPRHWPGEGQSLNRSPDKVVSTAPGANLPDFLKSLNEVSGDPFGVLAPPVP
jgi:hypothetical protein